MEKEEKGQSKMRYQATLNYDTETDTLYLTNNDMDNEMAFKALTRFYSHRLKQLSEKDPEEALGISMNLLKRIIQEDLLVILPINKEGEVSNFLTLGENNLSLEDNVSALLTATFLMVAMSCDWDPKQAKRIARKAQIKTLKDITKLFAEFFLASEKEQKPKLKKTFKERFNEFCESVRSFWK